MYDERDLDIKSLKRDLPELFRPEYDGGYLLENGKIDWRSMRRDLPELFKPYFDGGYLRDDITASSDINEGIPSIPEMKDILYTKLQDEGSRFKKSDIIIKKKGDEYIFQIAGYDSIWFTMTFEYDDDFGYIVWVDKWFHRSPQDEVAFITSEKDYDVNEALIELGYYIGATM